MSVQRLFALQNNWAFQALLALFFLQTWHYSTCSRRSWWKPWLISCALTLQQIACFDFVMTIADECQYQKGRDDQHSHLFEPLWEWYAWIVKPRPKKRNLIAAEVDFKQSAWHFWTPDIFQYFSILFTCFCPTDACRQPGSELLTRETASRVKKLKELFHKMDAQRVGTSSFNGQDMLRPAYWNEGSDWVGPVFCALILPWHWHVVSWHAASMCFHFAPLVRKLLVPKDEHGSKRVSCHEFQDNVDQHVKDELGKLQFPGSSIMLLLCFTRGSPLTA